MNKFFLGIRGYISCFKWAFSALWRAAFEQFFGFDRDVRIALVITSVLFGVCFGYVF